MCGIRIQSHFHILAATGEQSKTRRRCWYESITVFRVLLFGCSTDFENRPMALRSASKFGTYKSVMALASRKESSKPFKLFHLHSEAEIRRDSFHLKPRVVPFSTVPSLSTIASQK